VEDICREVRGGEKTAGKGQACSRASGEHVSAGAQMVWESGLAVSLEGGVGDKW
jgi:hypothetical protein